MRKLVMGCTVAGLIALAPKSEARLPTSVRVVPLHLVVPRVECEFGLASWYGEERQGNTMASGQPFDKHSLTAAHRKLPLGATIKVTNLKNNRTILLCVTDRGPGIEGRLIDVSWAAAKRLGFLAAGLTPVKIQIVHSTNRSIPFETAQASHALN
jgi:rare lipoprotein A